VQLKVTFVEVIEKYFNVIANRYGAYSASLDNGIVTAITIALGSSPWSYSRRLCAPGCNALQNVCDW
jgi:hypothetical protein